MCSSLHMTVVPTDLPPQGIEEFSKEPYTNLVIAR